MPRLHRQTPFSLSGLPPRHPKKAEGDQGSFLGSQAILQLSMGDVCIQRPTLGPGALENEDE